MISTNVNKLLSKSFHKPFQKILISKKAFSSSQLKILDRQIHSIKKNSFGTGGAASSLVVKDPSEGVYVLSPHPDVKKVTGVTIPEILKSRTSQHGNCTLFESSTTGQKYTYDEIMCYSRSFAKSLLQSGLSKGDIVAVALPNVPEYAIVLFGIWEAGLIVTTVNPEYTQYEMEYQLKTTNTKCVVTNKNILPTVESVRKSLLPQIQSIITVGEGAEECHNFSDMIKNNINGEESFFTNPTSEDLALISFSSGTTGAPKGIMLTHENICTTITQLITPGILNLAEYNPSNNFQEKFIGALPFFHAYGLIITIYLPIARYIHNMCIEKYDFDKYIQTIRKHKPTVLHTVAPMFHRLASNSDVTEEDLKSVHTVMNGATSIDPFYIKMFLKKAGNNDIFLQSLFGTTEAGPSAVLLSKDREKFTSIGTLLPGMKAKIVDIDSGKTLGPLQKGEFLVNGPQTFGGYFKNEKATRETIEKGNWVRTGDLAYFDNEGCFYIEDRIKDVLNVKGFKVSPSELENTLKEHPNVVDAAVIGVADKHSGELPRAYIILSKGDNVSADDIHTFMKSRLTDYKQLKGGIEFVDSIPRASSGKLLRKLLKTK